MVGVLDELSKGMILYYDHINRPTVGMRHFGESTPKKLSELGLIEKRSPSKNIKYVRNGYVISKDGLSFLEQYRDNNGKQKKETSLPPSKANDSSPATQSQLDYAKKYNFKIPQNATSADLSCLLTIAERRDKPSTERDKEFARIFGVKLNSQYIGKKGLFNCIKWELDDPSRDMDLLCWFIFRVYRGLVEGNINVPIKTPKDQAIKSIAEQFIENDKIMRSIYKYEGMDLIFFGTYIYNWTYEGEDWEKTYYGGSKATTAYKEVSLSLRIQML